MVIVIKLNSCWLIQANVFVRLTEILKMHGLVILKTRGKKHFVDRAMKIHFVKKVILH